MVPHPVRPAIIQGAKDDLNVDLAYADFEPINGEAYLDAAPAREDAQ
ncbi:hypothetical protein KWG63_14295 [Brevundimonas nasdae]|nr:hypothetical protein [Brevundimonas nasdae]QYC13373.1 hypothetical protein KWG63_14295 [Brevundimonas nasdae]